MMFLYIIILYISDIFIEKTIEKETNLVVPVFIVYKKTRKETTK